LQELLHSPDPEQLTLQFWLQPVSSQAPAPVQASWQPLPEQLSSVAPTPAPVALHLPLGHKKVQAPLPEQRKSQPVPVHSRVQAPNPAHSHSAPAAQGSATPVCETSHAGVNNTAAISRNFRNIEASLDGWAGTVALHATEFLPCRQPCRRG